MPCLLSIAFVWGMMCLANMDMGEFYTLRKWFLMIVPVGFVLVLTHMKEFLSVRALGCRCSWSVASCSRLPTCNRRQVVSCCPVIAYAWIIAGLIVWMPFLMRDAVNWVTANDQRWKLAALAFHGAAILVAALLWW